MKRYQAVRTGPTAHGRRNDRRTDMTLEPSLYHFGLVAYLTKYSSPEILANGALAGHILENYVVMEIMKSYKTQRKIVCSVITGIKIIRKLR